MNKNIANYTDFNAAVFNNEIENGWCWGMPVSHEVYQNAVNGEWDLLPAASRPVPRYWFKPFLKENKLTGIKLLGLASGGGQQMPILAALGAECTVMDYSDKQLELEKMVSEREGYDIEIIKADMSKHFPFEDESFHIIFHAISNCYVEDVYHVWNECFRVLKKGGLLLAGMDNGINFLFNDHEADPLIVTDKVPYNPLKNQALFDKCIKDNGSLQFSHTLEEQIGGQLKAGFILTDLYEDQEKEGNLAKHFPQYIVTRAVKPN